MNPGSENQTTPANPVPDMESLLSSIAKEEADAAKAAATQAAPEPQVCDFRSPALLSARELRKFRMHQEEFVRSLASRLSLHLRLEFSLKLAVVNTVTYKTLSQSWQTPSHLTLFKLEPLRGVAILEIAPKLGLAIVDRLMGGPGQAPEAVQEVSEIEQALLEQSVQMLLEEWCSHWVGIKELKPAILGYESNGRFIQTAPPDTMMLVVSMEGSMGECEGIIQMGFPFASFEPLLSTFGQGASAPPEPVLKAPVPTATLKWNKSFDEVAVPVSAEWDGLEMTARAVLNLKVGDIVPMSASCTEQVNVRLGGLKKFHGRPGTIAGQWAVQLTEAVKA